MAQGYSGDTAKALGLLEDLKGIIVKQENTIRVQQLKVELLSSRARELEGERDVLRRRVDELSRELRGGRTRSQFSTFKPYPRPVVSQLVPVPLFSTLAADMAPATRSR
ncbi:Hypp2992 [Branchiostoma lanceolatum]|uniref:Hypp2992 protein n=1 Tax=Branchiostoma lanceolatum TaxID=7740 RepID=A0A8K0ES99_BRALA|nr:Hypp2992 [Branchiostoma lanceolatum]